MTSHADAHTDAKIHGEKESSIVHETNNDSDNPDPPKESNGTKVENDDSINSDFQAGIQNIEAVTITWGTNSLIVAYVLIWIIYFVQGLLTGVTGALLPYFTSTFAEQISSPS
jgi:fucose permease